MVCKTHENFITLIYAFSECESLCSVQTRHVKFAFVMCESTAMMGRMNLISDGFQGCLDGTDMLLHYSAHKDCKVEGVICDKGNQRFTFSTSPLGFCGDYRLKVRLISFSLVLREWVIKYMIVDVSLGMADSLANQTPCKSLMQKFGYTKGVLLRG